MIALMAACMDRWLLPMVGHMGIATSAGVIRDFAGPYFVSVCVQFVRWHDLMWLQEDRMGFGWPTRYLVLSPSKAHGGRAGWDRSVSAGALVCVSRSPECSCADSIRRVQQADAQPVLRQLPLARRHGSGTHALQRPHILEHVHVDDMDVCVWTLHRVCPCIRL
jgi:hypothetical protein